MDALITPWSSSAPRLPQLPIKAEPTSGGASPPPCRVLLWQAAQLSRKAAWPTAAWAAVKGPGVCVAALPALNSVMAATSAAPRFRVWICMAIPRLAGGRIELRQEPGGLLRHIGGRIFMPRQQPAPQVAAGRFLAVDLDIQLAGAESGGLLCGQGQRAGDRTAGRLRHGEIQRFGSRYPDGEADTDMRC